MRGLLGFVIASVLVLGGRPASGDLLTPEESKWVRECMERLDANAPRLRKSAEQALVGMGREMLPAVVANLKRVKGRTAEAGLMRVLLSLGRSRVLQDLTRMARDARPADRKRIEELMARLGDALGVGEPLKVQMSEAVFTSWQQVPHGVEYTLTSGWPQSLLPGGGAAKVVGNTIEISPKPNHGTKQVVTRSAPRAIPVQMPGRTLPAAVLVYNKLGQWYAASGAIQRGEVGKLVLEVWDTNLDGRFDGPQDMARILPGAWQLLAKERRLAHRGAVVSLLLDVTAAGLQAKLTAEARPAVLDPDHLDFLDTLYRWRAAHGLGPLVYDTERSRGCMEHSRYLVLNSHRKEVSDGGAAHYQDPNLPGATELGAEAGSSSVLRTGGLDSLVRGIAITMLHRIAWIAPTGSLLGVGSAREGRAAWCTAWTERSSAASDPRLVTVPAPGAEDVIAQGGAEWPPPDTPRDWYKAPRGYPISVTHAHLGLRNPKLSLYRDAGPEQEPTPVPAQVWSPERPIAASYASNRGTVFLMANRPFERGGAYWVLFEADGAAGPVRYAWTFKAR